jgi:hypothetical protein
LIDAQAAKSLTKNFQVEFSSQQTLKGKRNSQPVYTFGEQKIPTTAELLTGSWIGRQQEKQQTLDFLSPLFAPNVARPFAGILSLYGEPGVGKTRFLHEIQAQLQSEQRPHLWLTAPCDPILNKAFAPFVYLLNQYFEQSELCSGSDNKARFFDKMQALRAWLKQTPIPHLPTTTRTALQRELGRADSFLGALLNLQWPDSLYAQIEPRLRFENTLYAFRTLIQVESLRQPVILILEDAQWLDPDSLKLLQALSRPPYLFPFALLISSRYQDDGTPFNFSLDEEAPPKPSSCPHSIQRKLKQWQSTCSIAQLAHP